jgi:hypothetical protein
MTGSVGRADVGPTVARRGEVPRLSIDDISYKPGYRHLTVVVDLTCSPNERALLGLLGGGRRDSGPIQLCADRVALAKLGRRLPKMGTGPQ